MTDKGMLFRNDSDRPATRPCATGSRRWQRDWKSSKAVEPSAQVLHFPADRSIGTLYTQEWDFPTATVETADDWNWLGEAKGGVTTPSDKALKLGVHEDGCRNGVRNLKIFVKKGVAEVWGGVYTFGIVAGVAQW